MTTIRNLKFTTAFCLARPPLSRRTPALAAALAACLPALSVGAEATIQFDIPAQDLSRALAAFTAQSHVQVLYEGDVAKGLRSAPLKGSYTPEKALKALLTATPIQARFTGARTATLERTAKSPSPESDAGGAVALGKVTVSATAGYDANDPYNRDYAVPNASTATKTDTPIFDTPVSIQVVPRAVIDDQQAIRPKDALKNVSGVQPGFRFGNLRDGSIIRGFETDSFPQGGSYLDGVLQFEASNSLANIERIEVLKGASAMLFGRLEPGGLINYVSKRPLKEAYYSIQQQFGSFDSYRTTLDATGAVIGDDSLLYRVNFEYLDSDSFRDFVTSERVFVAPSLTWNITEHTKIDIDFIYQKDDNVNDYGLPAFGKKVANLPVSRFTGEPGQLSNTETFQEAITFSHAFNDDWKVKSKYAKYDMNGAYNETVLESLNEVTGIGDRWLYYAPNGIDSHFFTTDITGHFSTGPFKHTLLFGGDYYNRKYNEDGIFVDKWYTANGLFPTPIDIYNPVYGYDRQAVLAGQPRSFSQRKDEWWGLYLQDQIDFNDQWHLMLGGRFDHADSSRANDRERNNTVEQSSDEKFSPRIGLMYQPVEWIGFFTNYSEAFNSPNIGRNALDGSALGSQTSKQYETGIKGNWFEGRLTASAVFFHLIKNNIAQPTSPIPGSPYNLSGEARSQGLEIDVNGKITDYWDVITTYTYTDAKFTDDPNNKGNRLPNVAHHMGSAWTNFHFDEFGLQGLSAGAGAFVIGPRFGDNANSFEMPGYVRFDTSLAYKMKLAETTLTAQFNVENLLDKRYFLASGSRSYLPRISTTPGAERTFLGSLRLEF
jgi:iron complex outermembrane receptor protein